MLLKWEKIVQLLFYHILEHTCCSAEYYQQGAAEVIFGLNQNKPQILAKRRSIAFSGPLLLSQGLYRQMFTHAEQFELNNH